MNDIENKFIADYIKKDGFWYTFKRSAAELDKIYAHFNLLKVLKIKSGTKIKIIFQKY